MYTSALALLLKEDISPETHEGTLRQLTKTYYYLYDAKTIRNKSSYDYSIVFSEKLAKELLLQAEIFIDEVETLL